MPNTSLLSSEFFDCGTNCHEVVCFSVPAIIVEMYKYSVQGNENENSKSVANIPEIGQEHFDLAVN